MGTGGRGLRSALPVLQRKTAQGRARSDGGHWSLPSAPVPAHAPERPAADVRVPAAPCVPSPRLLALGLLLGLGTFFLLAFVVAGREAPAVDFAVLRVFRSHADPLNLRGPVWLAELVRDITALGAPGVVMAVALAAALGLWLQGRRAEALFLLVLLGVSYLAMSGAKALVARPRPSLFPHLARVFSRSFPSGHSMLSASLYPTVAWVLSCHIPSEPVRRLVLGLSLLVVLLVGMSRVMLGVHYPSDMVAGWALGCACASATWLLARRMRPFRASRPARP